jgi:hypothetical protein
MTLEDAFLTGFIKAALSLPSTPKMPDITPAMSSGPVNNIPSSAYNDDTTLGTLKRLPNALTSFPITTGSNTNYTFNVLGDNTHAFTNTPPNTLDINAHGGAYRKDDLYEIEGRDNMAIQDLILKEPEDTYGMVADPRVEPVNKGKSWVTEGDAEVNPFTEKDMANRIGSHTNDIRQFRSGACNAGLGCRTNINPNSIVKGYNTPAYLKSIYPNLTNAIIVPPGSYGPLRPINNNPIEPLLSQFKMDYHNFKNPKSPKIEYTHQYGLQDNGWVDKGPYYNY